MLIKSISNFDLALMITKLCKYMTELSRGRNQIPGLRASRPRNGWAIKRILLKSVTLWCMGLCCAAFKNNIIGSMPCVDEVNLQGILDFSHLINSMHSISSQRKK